MTGLERRRERLSEALASVRERIAKACEAAGRHPDEVELMAVTKTRPATDLALLLDLGHDMFGENRPQEAAAKVAELSELRPGNAARWHLVGRLQRNKARSVARWATRVESVDSVRLVDALDDAVRRAIDAGERPGPLPVLLQVSLDGDPERGGAPLGELPALADRVAETEGLELHGLMAVAPLGVDPDQAFADLAEAQYRMGIYHPRARVTSAGMTADFEAAIRHGSTCVRVGTALLGDRPLTSS
ncbi:YggS family pyridoxal phosphate-dependent enzyme [Pseudonocardia acaciae]|uniref:YggS family pyridoxal phosphate-dependent enzyme n=1 Tax=Pseudonocardia acaciae TaxID=551276 RepID=UPI0005672242|nr:YggS family pyridoxal phosphate-dependent enzyme [Pseudonocardia acaciae]